MERPLIVDLPYPSIESLTQDLESANIILGAYASKHSELQAILQYVYHHFFFFACGEEKIAKILIEISVAEMKHLEMLGQMLLKLGIDPMFYFISPYRREFFSSECVNYSKTTQKMLLDDISGELVAISEYNKMLNNLKNEEVGAMIKRIVLDEELHVRVLKDCLDNVINKYK